VSFTVRHLAAADIAQLRALNVLFGVAFAEPETYGAQPPDDAYLQDLLQKRHVIILVALADAEVVGGLVAYQLEKFERARSEIYIYDLAVREDHRRRGVATGLIGALGQIGKARGAYVIYVQADPGDDPAIHLYESLGTREDVHHFDIPVPR